MKKIAIIALTIGIMVGCQKKSSAPAASSSSTSTTSTIAGIHCIYSYTMFLECNGGTDQDAITKAQWYRDHNYTMVTVVKKNNCSECQ